MVQIVDFRVQNQKLFHALSNVIGRNRGVKQRVENFSNERTEFKMNYDEMIQHNKNKDWKMSRVKKSKDVKEAFKPDNEPRVVVMITQDDDFEVGS